MKSLIELFIILPKKITSYLLWLAPLFARIVVGYVFMLTGWYKLNHLSDFINNFIEWGIPFPTLFAPFVSGVEFCGGILLFFGLLTRLSATALAIVMIVAVAAAKTAQIDSLETLLGFEEVAYLVIFIWLAFAGAGQVSIDYLLEKKQGV